MSNWFGKELFAQGTSNVFVFGANILGKHGAGAAKFAHLYCGAQYGCGFGLQGNSFAIPTKDELLRTLSLDVIAQHVRQFLYFVQQNPHLTFYLSPIGTGLAGYQHHHIAPLFSDAPRNLVLPDVWKINPEPKLLVEKT